MSPVTVLFAVVAILSSLASGKTGNNAGNKVQQMISEIQSVLDSEPVSNYNLRENIYIFPNAEINNLCKAALENTPNVVIPAAVRLLLIKYFEMIGKIPPENVFMDCSLNDYRDILISRAVIDESPYENQEENVNVILQLLDAGYNISTELLSDKLKLLIMFGHNEAAKKLFQRIDREKVSSFVLSAAVMTDNYDMAEFILKSTISFDRDIEGANSDMMIFFAIKSKETKMINLLMAYKDKLKLSPNIGERANSAAAASENALMINRIKKIFPH